MAFDDATRGRLQKLVGDARTLLTTDFTNQFQQDYGLDPESGDVASLDALKLDDQRLETARILRQIFDHYLASAIGQSAQVRKAVLGRMVSEQAFTTLNRVAALRMMEARGLLMECVAKGYQSKAFQLYQRVAGSALGETGDTYRVFLLSLCDLYSADLPTLFDRHYPNGRLSPSEPALLPLLDLVNATDIAPLWGEDETIGWIYQYFNSKEERKAMRDASSAPRDSRELAVRNQFFTPRYVVEFLVDNTLGRLWFNWTGGQTGLRDLCQYLLVKPDEQPQASQHLRDPRTIKLLDPACGSMHFGLYAFDLFLEIYREAWAWEQTHGPGCLDAETGAPPGLKPLCLTYTDEMEFLRDVPRLVIECNIYGVDIDPRAAQIAALALWLRAQRAWHEAAVKAQDRPQVGRGHVVAAVAPPAEVELRKGFMASLDQSDAVLFEKTLFLLKGLPELGVLLQVEKELPKLIRSVFGEHGALFKSEDITQWQNAEVRLQGALSEFADAARSSYQGRLFAVDALQGLRLSDITREQFDVIVMNPPFGEAASEYTSYLKQSYGRHANNLFCSFIARALGMAPSGYLGAITDNTWLKKADYEDFRSLVLDGDMQLSSLIDLGWGVLDDANVATCAFIINSSPAETVDTVGLVDVKEDKKGETLGNLIQEERERTSVKSEARKIKALKRIYFDHFPGRAIAYEAPENLLPLFENWSKVNPAYADVRRGYTPGDTYRFFKTWWEIKSEKLGRDWWTLNNGGSFSPLIDDGFLIARHDDNWSEYRPLSGFRLESENWFGTPGIGWGKRTDFMYAYPLPAGSMFSNEGHCAFPKKESQLWPLISYFNSRLGQALLNLFCGQHKQAGYVSKLPCPPLDSPHMISAGNAAKAGWDAAVKIMSTNEQSEHFCFWFARNSAPWKMMDQTLSWLNAYTSQFDLIDEAVYNEASFASSEFYIDKQAGRPITFLEKYCRSFDWSRSLISALVGYSFDRWSLDCQNRRLAEELDDSARPLAYGSTGNFADKDLLVSDVSSDFDLSDMVRESIFFFWPESVDEVESRLLSHINVAILRSYIDSPSGFFSDHLDNYSKGRRSAPIYWPLSTETGSYTLWIYYPALTSQTLYTAINNLIEPKLQQVRSDVAAMRAQGASRSREDEKRFEAGQALELELINLRNAILDIAPIYRPNHDDGVQISAAPLWALFRHKLWQKLLAETWAELERGDYDWSHLAMAYWPGRVREKCKTDKSLAIAHGLEELYEPPQENATGAGRGGRKRRGAAP